MSTSNNSNAQSILNHALQEAGTYPNNPFFTQLNFGSYIDSFKRVIKNPEYAREKHLLVSEQEGLYLIKYDREHLTPENAKTLGLFRSVIIKEVCEYGKNETITDYIILFAAQPKSVDLEEITFAETRYPIYIESIIEGTMINLFHDGHKWRIATRSCIGADTQFYQDDEKTLSYRQMFMETFKAKGLKLEYFQKGMAYSFVLQHPENRIVMPIKKANLFLVNIFAPQTLEGYKNVCYMQLGEDGHLDYLTQANFFHPELRRTVGFSRVTAMPQENAIREFLEYEKRLKEGDYDWRHKGIFVRSILGHHAKLVNAKYQYVADLTDNQPKTQYRFYSLLKKTRETKSFAGRFAKDMVAEYLSYFPEHDKLFREKYTPELEQWMVDLWHVYMEYWGENELDEVRLPAQFKKCILQILDLTEDLKYSLKLDELKDVVMDNLDTKLIMYSVNFNKGK